jgi:hypothetical protein
MQKDGVLSSCVTDPMPFVDMNEAIWEKKPARLYNEQVMIDNSIVCRVAG